MLLLERSVYLKSKVLIYGSGWRVEGYLRIMKTLAHSYEVTAVITTNNTKNLLYTEQGFTCVATLEEGLAIEKPDFILLCINMKFQAAKVLELLDIGIPILVETPLGTSWQELQKIQNHPQSRRYLQVAEQYRYRPLSQAQLTIINQGIIGQPHTAQISVTNNYHAFSLMKSYLGTPGRLHSVSTERFFSPTRSGFSREKDTMGTEKQKEQRVLALVEFENGHGIYDFESNQHRSYTRFSSLDVRGEKGEIRDEFVRYISADGPAEGKLIRIERGINENMEGFGLKGIQFNGQWVYQNPWPNVAFSDDDLATATVLQKMCEFYQAGYSFYGVDDAVEDMEFTLLLEQALENEEKMFALP